MFRVEGGRIFLFEKFLFFKKITYLCRNLVVYSYIHGVLFLRNRMQNQMRISYNVLTFSLL